MLFLLNALLPLVLVASTPAAGAATSGFGRRAGKATLGFSTQLNAQGVQNVADVDRARASAIVRGKASAIDATNAVVHSVAQIGVGTPPTNYALLVATGTANTFVGAGKEYVKTSSSVDTGYFVSVTYNTGEWDGTEWNDTVTLGPDLVVHQQSIGVARSGSTSGFAPGLDGVLGLGPVALTEDTVQGMSTVPTVLNNLRAQGVIGEEVLGVYFTPSAEKGSRGELMFGGYDASVTTTPVAYVPLTKAYPSSRCWGIEQSVRYGSETILASTTGIVDSATTLVLIATDAFKKYQTLTGGVIDSSNGMLTITPDQYAKLQPLSFDIGGTSFQLTANAQIWPRSLNAAIGGSTGKIYLVIGDIGYTSGSGLDFINGFTFLERFYSVYDTANKRVGFAHTKYTSSTSN